MYRRWLYGQGKALYRGSRDSIIDFPATGRYSLHVGRMLGEDAMNLLLRCIVLWIRLGLCCMPRANDNCLWIPSERNSNGEARGAGEQSPAFTNTCRLSLAFIIASKCTHIHLYGI